MELRLIQRNWSLKAFIRRFGYQSAKSLEYGMDKIWQVVARSITVVKLVLTSMLGTRTKPLSMAVVRTEGRTYEYERTTNERTKESDEAKHFLLPLQELV